ncbi:unnamed protein product [Protopolystoma xenopodis]|uniref:Myosin N-terminal SH3-like domain-containing protein n=1 Tax=Protopolystoma xenopodis TaxID=117903 RepID=A0A448WW92_9PLAT|nr:unnamed protein product [Protopolystoma xenopodis]
MLGLASKPNHALSVGRTVPRDVATHRDRLVAGWLYRLGRRQARGHFGGQVCVPKVQMQVDGQSGQASRLFDFLYLGVDRKKVMKEAEAGGMDSKNLCWVEDEKEGYILADIAETTGDMVTVKKKDGVEKKVRKDDIQQLNPPKFFLIEDMANLTFLNDASVLENLRARYYRNLIYVSYLTSLLII